MKRWFFFFGYAVIPLLSYPVAEAFEDVSSDYLYHRSIEKLDQGGWLRECRAKAFCPEQPITEVELWQNLKRHFPETPWPRLRSKNLVNVARLQEVLDRDLVEARISLPTFITSRDLVNRGELAEIIVRMKSGKKILWYSDYDAATDRFTLRHEGPVKRIPWKINLGILPHMRLEGRDFRLGEKIFENSYYRSYRMSYLSNGVRVVGLVDIPKNLGDYESMNLGAPVLVLAHGYYPKDIYWSGMGMGRERDFFVRRGFVVVSPDYRGYGKSDDNPENRRVYDGAMGYAMDVVNLVDSLKNLRDYESRNLGELDMDNLFFFGHSMGGATGLNIGTMFPDLFKAMVIYAPSGGAAWRNFDRWWRDISWQDQSEVQWGAPRENARMWNQISPMTFLRNWQTPLQIYHGTRDGEKLFGVPTRWSDDLVGAFEVAGKSLGYFRKENAGHVFYGKDWREMVEGAVKLFLK